MKKVDDQLKLCSLCWKNDSLGIVRYDSAFGVFEIGSFHPSQFHSVLDKIMIFYKITDFLISYDTDKSIINILESHDEVNIIFCKNSDFSFSNGLDALNSMTYLVPEEERDKVRKSISSGIIDISSKAVIGAISAIYIYMTKNNRNEIDHDQKIRGNISNKSDSFENDSFVDSNSAEFDLNISPVTSSQNKEKNNTNFIYSDDEIIDLSEQITYNKESIQSETTQNSDELALNNDENKFIVSSFKTLEISHGLYLPKSAADELQIITYDIHPSIHNSSMRSKDGLSLFSLFNRCSTLMGKIRLRSWFLRTLDSIDQINERLDIIETFVSDDMHPYINEIISKLHSLPEICHLLIRLQKESMTQSHWQRLHKGLTQAASLCQLVESYSLPVFENNKQFFGILNSETSIKFNQIADEIETTIDLKSHSIYVRDDYDPQLFQMRKNYSKLDSILTDVAKKLMNGLPSHCAISELSVVYIPQQGFLTTILKSTSLTCQDLPPGYSLLFQTDTHYYCKNKAMTDLDEQLGDIYTNILAREIRVIVALSDKIMSIGSLINQTWDSIGILDAFCSLSIVAVDSHFVRPIINTANKDLVIKNGRHPLLEKCTNHLVPNSTESMETECPIHIITGPNSSGKSIYLKQIALIIYLSHIGSFVPADEAIVPLTDFLFCYFQTSNYLSNQPFSSSFIDETKKVAEALYKSTEKSVIILDEYGKTSNYLDGSSLLCGIVRYLNKRGNKCPKVFISTHFHNILKSPFLEPQMFIPCVMNIKFIQTKRSEDSEEEENSDDNQNHAVLFLYQLIKGDNGLKASSFGLHCARQAGLADDIVDRAEVVASCFEQGKPIPPNENCINLVFEEKCKKALSLFFKFDSSSGKPRMLLKEIDNIIYNDEEF